LPGVLWDADHYLASSVRIGPESSVTVVDIGATVKAVVAGFAREFIPGLARELIVANAAP
jgi:hypothetical protein